MRERQTPFWEDPTTYRIEYSRVAQRLHLLSVRGEDSDRREAEEVLGPLASAFVEAMPETELELGTTRELAIDLIEHARLELLRLGWRYAGRPPRGYMRKISWRNSRDDRMLGEFLDGILEPAAVVLYFSVLTAIGEPVEPLSPDPPQELDRRAGAASDPPWLRAYLALLLQAEPERAPEKGLSAWLKGLRWKRRQEPGYRVSYNLACLTSRYAASGGESAAGYLVVAAMELNRCVHAASDRERRAIVAWAWRDPGLQALRDLDHDLFARTLDVLQPLASREGKPPFG